MTWLASVALALDDVGLALPVQEALEAAGHRVTWNAGLTPKSPGARFDVVVVAASAEVKPIANGWRDLDPPPAVLAVGAAADQAHALAAAVAFVGADQPPRAIAAAAERALAHRWCARLSPAFARGALGLPTSGDPTRDGAAVVAGARRAPTALALEALRGHADSYVHAQPMIAALRELRALEVPELEVIQRLDGSRTVRTACAAVTGLDAEGAARLVWALCSLGAAALSDEPAELGHATSRGVSEARRHLRARRARAAKTTIYDLLETHRKASAAEVDEAMRRLAIRFAPERTTRHDLGNLTPLAAPLWEQLLKARAVFADPNRLALYDAKIKEQPPAGAVWFMGPFDTARAEDHMARGQKALVDGEAFKAVSELAAAARVHPDHPDYETALAWARFRAEVTRGKDKLDCARRERANAEAVTYGRRPWSRALVALALLCAATEDPEAARWHLREALECDPSSPTARQLLARLGR
jgi:hypothetical protein